MATFHNVIELRDYHTVAVISCYNRIRNQMIYCNVSLTKCFVFSDLRLLFFCFFVGMEGDNFLGRC